MNFAPRGASTGTRSPRRTPAARSAAATAFARASSSAYVSRASPAMIAVAPGCSRATRSKSAPTGCSRGYGFAWVPHASIACFSSEPVRVPGATQGASRPRRSSRVPPARGFEHPARAGGGTGRRSARRPPGGDPRPGPDRRRSGGTRGGARRRRAARTARRGDRGWARPPPRDRVRSCPFVPPSSPASHPQDAPVSAEVSARRTRCSRGLEAALDLLAFLGRDRPLGGRSRRLSATMSRRWRPN